MAAMLTNTETEDCSHRDGEADDEWMNVHLSKMSALTSCVYLQPEPK